MPRYALVLGAQKAGTTSLYAWLARHRGVAAAMEKEVHFFDLQFARGMSWYESRFPSEPGGESALRLDASPYYVFHPAAPRRAAGALPRARLVILLRDPVERAFSQWKHERRLGFEDLDLEAALDAEASRLAGAGERLEREVGYTSHAHQHWSYTGRGLYLPQLRRWEAAFAREQMWIALTDDLLERQEQTLADLLSFLDLPGQDLGSLPHLNVGAEGAGLAPALRERLNGLFRPHMPALAEYLGRRLPWECAR